MADSPLDAILKVVIPGRGSDCFDDRLSKLDGWKTSDLPGVSWLGKLILVSLATCFSSVPVEEVTCLAGYMESPLRSEHLATRAEALCSDLSLIPPLKLNTQWQDPCSEASHVRGF